MLNNSVSHPDNFYSDDEDIPDLPHSDLEDHQDENLITSRISSLPCAL